MTDYQIRPLRQNEIPGLIKLITEHTAYEKAVFNAEGKAEKLMSAIFGTTVRLYCEVVEQRGKLIGFASYTFDFSTWDASEFMYMDCLFLREETRGQGIGTKILEKLQDVARKKGCHNIQWQTPDFNEPAIRFYKRIGAAALSKERFTFTL